MKTKINKEYVDTTLGFPILLRNVQMIQVLGVWVPKVNYSKIAYGVVASLLDKREEFSGYELRFVRNYFDMTVCDFAQAVGIEVEKIEFWEKEENASSPIDKGVGSRIREFLTSKLGTDPGRGSKLRKGECTVYTLFAPPQNICFLKQAS